jgi:hypothetical protein
VRSRPCPPHRPLPTAIPWRRIAPTTRL